MREMWETKREPEKSERREMWETERQRAGERINKLIKYYTILLWECTIARLQIL